MFTNKYFIKVSIRAVVAIAFRFVCALLKSINRGVVVWMRGRT